MALIGDYITRAQPVSPDTPGSVVLERFQAEPNTLVIAVVDDQERPCGLVERNAFCLRMAAAFGRELYAGRPISALMDDRPTIVQAEDNADALFASVQATDLGALMSGFIATSGQRYVGVGASLQVLQAGNALYRARADEMAELARVLALAEAEAHASSRAKSEFLAVMSHEIRTPLNGVLGVAGLMSRILTQEDLRPHVETILASGESLLRLLTDALDMSRAQAGAMTLEVAPMDLSVMVDDLHALWGARAEEKGLQLDIALASDARRWVSADVIRLKQLLNNLIGNAIKFTPEGAVEVSLSSASSVDGRLRLTGMVDDTGPGLSPEAARRIFDPFNTGEAHREGAGAGLGLAICRQIVERMGGVIGVETSPSGGARFRFEVQVEAAEAAHQPVALLRAEPTPHETLHVLVADDNAANRFLAGQLLTVFGCTYETVENGREAVERATIGHFDLILMDIKMPLMDGVDATRAIRALPGPASTPPILALTANADDRDAQLYRAAGMAGVVQKPIQPDLLLEAIRRAMAVSDAAPAMQAA